MALQQAMHQSLDIRVPYKPSFRRVGSKLPVLAGRRTNSSNFMLDMSAEIDPEAMLLESNKESPRSPCIKVIGIKPLADRKSRAVQIFTWTIELEHDYSPSSTLVF
jgi:hypothetical protein